MFTSQKRAAILGDVFKKKWIKMDHHPQQSFHDIGTP